jgi:hypothetical protein
VQVITVHNDKIPMLPSDGALPTLAFAIMPHTAHFDPPAPIRMPNVDAREPGEVVQLYSYDHDLGTFVIVGTATVSEDGQEIVSEHGQGIVKGGWHYAPPKPVTPACVGTSCRVDVCTTCGGPACPAAYVPQPAACWKCRLNVQGNPTNCCGTDPTSNQPVCCTVNPNTGALSNCSNGGAQLPPNPGGTPASYSPDYNCFGMNVLQACSGTCNVQPKTVDSQCRRGYDQDYPTLSMKYGNCVKPTLDNPQNRLMCCPTGNFCTGGAQTVCCDKACVNGICQ